MTKTYLITGAAGFIGMHVAKTLLEQGHRVIGADVVNDYYDPRLKQARLAELDKAANRLRANWKFYQIDLADKARVDDLFQAHEFERVIHLAAQAGVRHSLDHPEEYVHSNVIAFLNILEATRAAQTPHLVYASTSSVYGANTQAPFSEHHPADHPLQFYAATKRANELMAHSYSHLFDLPTTGLRFFTVYGPWGRPDMAPILFADAIRMGKKIKLFNNGHHSRDFTYVDDIVAGTLLAADAIPKRTSDKDALQRGPGRSQAPYRVFNIGNSEPTALTDFVSTLELEMGRTVEKELLPMQPGDVVDTFADVSELSKATGYAPAVPLSEGIARFVKWYGDYYE